jgi:hypothetical protein
MIAIIEDFLFLVSKNRKVDVVNTISLVEHELKSINDKYFAHDYLDTLKEYLQALEGVKRKERAKISIFETVKNAVSVSVSKNHAEPETVELLGKIKEPASRCLRRLPTTSSVSVITFTRTPTQSFTPSLLRK